MKMSFFFLILVWSLSGLAQNAQQAAVIQAQTRPSIEMLVANPELLAPFAVPAYDTYKQPSIFTETIPNLIVSLEKAFPGATYGFLGRDMDLVADALEAFYLSIGQRNRIKRIPMSTPTFANITEGQIVQFLQQRGLAQPNAKPNTPFVIVDVTSYATTSQSHQLISAVLNQYSQTIPVAEITKWVNLAVFNRGAKTASVFDALSLTPAQLTVFFQGQSQSIQNGHLPQLIGLPGKNMTYSSEWHGTYGQLQPRSDGWVSVPSEYFSYEAKKLVYHTLIGAVAAMIDPNFKAQVMAYAAQNGVTLLPPAAPVAPPKPPRPRSNTDFVKELASLQIAPLQNRDYDTVEFAGEKIKLTPNGTLLFEILADPKNIAVPDYLAIAMRTLVSFYENNLIGARDFRRIFISLIDKKELPAQTKKSPTLDGMSVIDYILSKADLEPMKILLDREREREKYLELGGVAEANYRLLVEDGVRPTFNYNCKNIFLIAQ